MTKNGTRAFTVFGALGAAAITIVALSTAWDVIGLPRFARADEVQALRHFSTQTRKMLLDDQLWDAERDLSRAQREADNYSSFGEVPQRLLDDILDLRRRINNRQAKIKGLP